MNRFFWICSCIVASAAMAELSLAVPKEIRLKYEYQHFIISNPAQFISKNETSNQPSQEKFCYGEEFVPPKHIKTTSEEESEINILSIESYLEKKIAPYLNQQKNDVRIFRDAKENIQFEGYAQKGVTLKISDSAKLIAFAIQNDMAFVNLEVDIENPTITVDDTKLQSMGIQDLVAVGRSDFNGSSKNRVHNVMTGANKFNGYIIPKDAIFSFTGQLGAVNKSTGYVKELVILGQKVIPDYGGGLCQVSSTAYRGAMLSGLEIVERHNHSYAVQYYEPAGSDATIYVGSKDFKFKNTSEGALLLQTRKGGRNNQELFFHYYGTPPNRSVYIYGPITKNYRKPPAPKTTVSEDLAPGERQVVSNEVVGFDSYFYRDVIENGESLYNDRFFSPYQARGIWTIQGAATTPVDPIQVEE